MDANNLQKLRIRQDPTGIKVVLDENELQNVKEYKVESSTAGTAELTLKLKVRFP